MILNSGWITVLSQALIFFCTVSPLWPSYQAHKSSVIFIHILTRRYILLIVSMRMNHLSQMKCGINSSASKIRSLSNMKLIRNWQNAKLTDKEINNMMIEESTVHKVPMGWHLLFIMLLKGYMSLFTIWYVRHFNKTLTPLRDIFIFPLVSGIYVRCLRRYLLCIMTLKWDHNLRFKQNLDILNTMIWYQYLIFFYTSAN